MGDASGRVIAVANMKGGVGKTTTVVMLAEGFAAEGARVLVIDLDAQTNASYCFAPDEVLAPIFERRHTVSSFLADHLIYGDKSGIAKYVTPGISDVTKAGTPLAIDLLAAHPRLRLLEREVMFRFSEEKRGIHALEGRSHQLLAGAMDALRKTYDVILLDCAPGISAFTEVAIRLADRVIVPTIPDYLSTIGLDVFRTSVWDNIHLSSSSLPKPKHPPLVLAARVNQTKVQHKRTLAIMREEAAGPDASYEMFDLTIENKAPIERAMDPEAFPVPPTFEQKWQNAVDLVRDLTSETRRRLDGRGDELLSAS
jgi:cellulose biosynthesis protein BcsQ